MYDGDFARPRPSKPAARLLSYVMNLQDVAGGFL
jgi:hypothetical protein